SRSGPGMPRAKEIVTSPSLENETARLGTGTGGRGSEVGDLGRRRADLDAAGLERFLLSLRRARRTGDDRAGMPHRLARRRRKAGDVGDYRLRHARLDVGSGLLLLVA